MEGWKLVEGEEQERGRKSRKKCGSIELAYSQSVLPLPHPIRIQVTKGHWTGLVLLTLF